MDTKKCLICDEANPISTLEHIVPESLVGHNDDLVLENEVCDVCQNYFALSVEKYVLEKTILCWVRVLHPVLNKKGRLPRMDSSLPRQKKGAIDQAVTIHTDAHYWVGTDGKAYFDFRRKEEAPDGPVDKLELKMEMTPNSVRRLGQFLGKMAIEWVCKSQGATIARSSRLAKYRNYARGRLGSSLLWPVYIKSHDAKEIGNKFSLQVIHLSESGPAWFQAHFSPFTFRMDMLSDTRHVAPEEFLTYPVTR